MEKQKIEKKQSDMKWSAEKRIEFIEFRLFWDGKINRNDIVKKFNISVPQASLDISKYQEMAPGNMEYNLSEKHYFASKSFKPKFLNPNSDQYLAQLKCISDKVIADSDAWVSNLPSLDSLPILHRIVDIKILREIVYATNNKKALEIYYQSMSEKNTDPLWRWITPHTFVNDGFRWHIRAFCHIDNRFKDFLLSRIIKTRGYADPINEKDNDWFEYINVILKPNPKLTKQQKIIIELDYGMKNGAVTIPIRKAFSFYFQRMLKTNIASSLDSKEVPVIVANPEVFKYIFIR